MIESHSNPHFKRWKSLLARQGINKHQQVLIMGRKIVPELKQQSKINLLEIICREDQFDLARSLQIEAPIRTVKNGLFQEIDNLGSHFPIACIAAPHIPKFDPNAPLEGLHLFLAMSDPQNLGATIRSAMAFGVRQIILLSESAHPFLPRSVRSSSGTLLSAPLSYGPKLSECKDLNLNGLDMDGTPIHQYQWPENMRLLIGEEGGGLPSFISDQNKISIPIQPNVESLNAMAATSIALFCYNHKQMT